VVQSGRTSGRRGVSFSVSSHALPASPSHLDVDHAPGLVLRFGHDGETAGEDIIIAVCGHAGLTAALDRNAPRALPLTCRIDRNRIECATEMSPRFTTTATTTTTRPTAGGWAFRAR
jgi:hypothetical protein